VGRLRRRHFLVVEVSRSSGVVCLVVEVRGRRRRLVVEDGFGGWCPRCRRQD
jgi:hypothetical protein